MGDKLDNILRLTGNSQVCGQKHVVKLASKHDFRQIVRVHEDSAYQSILLFRSSNDILFRLHDGSK